MPIRVSSLRLPIEETEDRVQTHLARALGVAPGDLGPWRILRKALDLRDKRRCSSCTTSKSSFPRRNPSSDRRPPPRSNSSTTITVSRILDLFPPSMHHAVRQTLAFNLKAVVAQKLVPSIIPGVQRVPTNEIMIVNPTIRDLILKSKDESLGAAIRIGELEGMQDFTMSLTKLVNEGKIDKATALEFAPNPDQLKMALKGIKVAAPGIL